MTALRTSQQLKKINEIFLKAMAALAKFLIIHASIIPKGQFNVKHLT